MTARKSFVTVGHTKLNAKTREPLAGEIKASIGTSKSAQITVKKRKKKTFNDPVELSSKKL